MQAAPAAKPLNVWDLRTYTTNQTLTNDDQLVSVQANSVTLTLPPSPVNGQMVYIRNSGGGSGNLTIAANTTVNAQTIVVAIWAHDGARAQRVDAAARPYAPDSALPRVAGWAVSFGRIRQERVLSVEEIYHRRTGLHEAAVHAARIRETRTARPVSGARIRGIAESPRRTGRDVHGTAAIARCSPHRNQTGRQFLWSGRDGLQAPLVSY